MSEQPRLKCQLDMPAIMAGAAQRFRERTLRQRRQIFAASVRGLVGEAIEHLGITKLKAMLPYESHRHDSTDVHLTYVNNTVTLLKVNFGPGDEVAFLFDVIDAWGRGATDEHSQEVVNLSLTSSEDEVVKALNRALQRKHVTTWLIDLIESTGSRLS